MQESVDKRMTNKAPSYPQGPGFVNGADVVKTR